MPRARARRAPVGRHINAVNDFLRHVLVDFIPADFLALHLALRRLRKKMIPTSNRQKSTGHGKAAHVRTYHFIELNAKLKAEFVKLLVS